MWFPVKLGKILENYGWTVVEIFVLLLITAGNITYLCNGLTFFFTLKVKSVNIFGVKTFHIILLTINGI